MLESQCRALCVCLQTLMAAENDGLEGVLTSLAGKILFLPQCKLQMEAFVAVDRVLKRAAGGHCDTSIAELAGEPVNKAKVSMLLLVWRCTLYKVSFLSHLS